MFSLLTPILRGVRFYSQYSRAASNKKLLVAKLQEYNGKKISDITCEIFKKHKVEHTFVYNGGAIMPIIDGIHRHKIPYYVNANEFCVGSAAVGYAKATGKPGISIVTSGPGLTNMVTSITDATNDSTPLIVLSGQVPVSAMGTNAFQECPATDITKSVTKWSYCIKDISEFPNALETAFRVATTGKKGAVHLDIPKCVANGIYEHKEEKTNKFFGIHRFDIPKFKKKSTSLEEMYNIISKSKKPVLYVGQGCNNASKELTKFAITNNIPVTTTMLGMGIFDETNSLSLEMCGMHGSVYANYALQNSDCIIAIGSRFDDRTTGVVEKYAPNAKDILHINISGKEIGTVINDHRYKYNISDSKVALNELNSFDKIQEDRTEWLNQINQWKKEFPFTYSKDTMKTQQVLETLNNSLDTLQIINPNNYIVTTDTGSHTMWSCMFIKWQNPRTMLSSGSLGCMGVGLPYAIGAQIAYPDKKVIAICGDFSFDMSLNDLRTIKEHKLPVKIFVMNDAAQSMVWAWTQYFFEGREAGVLRDPEFPKYAEIAKGYGIEAHVCEKQEDIEGYINYALNNVGPILIEFKVNKDKCFPLVKPGCSLDEVIYNEDYKPDKNTQAPC